MTDKRYYIAYGSNLNVPQMRMRCPHATILGTANLKGWELLFKGSKTGSYLTIEEREGGTVPVVIWEVNRVMNSPLTATRDSQTFTTSGILSSSTKASAQGNAGR